MRTLSRPPHVYLVPFVRVARKAERGVTQERRSRTADLPRDNWTTANGHITPSIPSDFRYWSHTGAPPLRRPSPFLRSGRMDFFSNFESSSSSVLLKEVKAVRISATKEYYMMGNSVPFAVGPEKNADI